MRIRGVPGRIGVAAVLLLAAGACASDRKPPLPTLSDYSDGVSEWAEAFLADWKTGGGDASLYAPGLRWSGPLPGQALSPVPSRPPLSIAIYRAPLGPATGPEATGPASQGGGTIAGSLAGIRARFASLGRSEAVLFAFRRRGPEREIVLGILLTGKGAGGDLRQEGGKLRLRLARAGRSGSWRATSGSVAEWMSASATEPMFEERAEAAGLGRIHRAFLPDAARNVPIPGEHMPPGAAVLDFDRDGAPDLFVPGGDGNRLYRNAGGGRFEDVAARAGVAGQEGEAVGALAFDYDGDGATDLYVTYLDRPNRLYRNRGDGTFEQVAEKAGVALSDYCTSAAALDYDRDGRPDLYVLVYGPRDRGPNVQANNAPPNHLFRNNGDGTFTDVTKATRTGDTGWGLALECADLDGDGWPDIYVANDFGNNTYLHNERDGTFRNRARRAGVLDAGFGMGVAIDDYDGDGRLDFYVSNYSFPMNWFLRDPRFPMPKFPYSLGRPLVWRRLTALSRGSSLFRPRGDGSFERTADEADVWDTSWSWGCVFVDADLDGRADLFVVNGMVTGKNATEHEIDFWNTMSAEYKKFEKGISTADFGEDSLWGHPPKRFYRNLDGRRFAELAAVTGLESDGNQRGLVIFDADGDGAPDLFATGFLQRPSLWMNRNPSRAKSLVVTLEGDPVGSGSGPWKSTREALGAVVTVEAGGLKRAQVVAAGFSFLSSGEKALFYGLGDAPKADRVTVLWPSGKQTDRRDVPAGRIHIAEAREASAAERGASTGANSRANR